MSVFVAVRRSRNGTYYWAKYSSKDEDLYIPPNNTKPLPTLPQSVTHIEICHVNGNHYNVVVNSNGVFTSTMPFEGDSSSNNGEIEVISLS